MDRYFPSEIGLGTTRGSYRSPSPMAGSVRIAFGCQARVGKDTAVDYLRQLYPQSTQLSFAAPLYEIQEFAQRRCGFPVEKDRRFLQWIGTEWGRSIDTDIWVKLAVQQARKSPAEESVFVSDVRFPNEMKAFQQEGFKLVRIIREAVAPIDTDCGRIDCGFSLSRRHASEIGLVDVPLCDWDYVIYNDGTLEDFQFKLKEMARMLEVPLTPPSTPS